MSTEPKTRYTAFLNKSRLLIEEKAGFGKSTLLRRVTIDYCDQFLSGFEKRIPIKLDAREIYLQVSERLEDWLAKYLKNRTGLNENDLKNLFLTQGINLIADGLDEASKEQRREFQSIFDGSKLLRKSNNQIIITTRPGWGIWLNSFDEPLSLDLFSINDVYQLVERWETYFRVENIVSKQKLDHLEYLKDKISLYSGNEAEMPKSIRVPLYLTYLIILAVTTEDIIEPIKVMNSEVSLYKRIFEDVIPEWEDIKSHDKGIKPSISELPTLNRRSILWAIAFTIQNQEDTTTSMTKNDLLGQLERMRKDYLAETTTAMCELGFQYWKGSNVLIVDGHHERVRFWHREMQEYGVARYLAEKCWFKDKSIEKDIEYKLLNDKEWQKVYQFYDAIILDEEHQL